MRDLGKLIVAKGFKSCPNSNKSPDLVTLSAWYTCPTESQRKVVQCRIVGPIQKWVDVIARINDSFLLHLWRQNNRILMKESLVSLGNWPSHLLLFASPTYLSPHLAMPAKMSDTFRSIFFNRPNPVSFCLFLFFSRGKYSTNFYFKW